MAYADYRHCDVCDEKVFYDADLNYEEVKEDGQWKLKLGNLGDWKVICDECAKTHEVVVRERALIAAPESKPEVSAGNRDVPALPDGACGAKYSHKARTVAVTFRSAEQAEAFQDRFFKAWKGASK
jgi:hypothetical protein